MQDVRQILADFQNGVAGVAEADVYKRQGGSGISGYSLKSNLLGAFFAGGLFLILYFVDFSWLQKHAGKFFLSAAAAAAVLKYCLLSGHGHGPESAWGDFFGYGFLEGLYQCMACLLYTSSEQRCA